MVFLRAFKYLFSKHKVGSDTLLLFLPTIPILISAFFIPELIFANSVGTVVFWISLGLMNYLIDKDSEYHTKDSDFLVLETFYEKVKNKVTNK